ncbi:MAG TPA: phage holin family protein [Bacteroidota bacterium]|nr:phage holin family protein [Bacteroidota bacterium]
MDNTHEHSFETLIEQAVEYGQTRIELTTLKAVEKVSDVISSVVSVSAAFILLIIAFLVLNIGLGLWLGDVLGRSYYGFFALGGFYVIIGALFYVLRHTFIKTMVGNAIISGTFK